MAENIIDKGKTIIREVEKAFNDDNEEEKQIALFNQVNLPLVILKLMAKLTHTDLKMILQNLHEK